MSSEKYEVGSHADADFDRNTEILHSRGFWPFYATVLVLARYVILFITSLVSPAWGSISLTTTSLVHTLLTVYAIHWVKGNPFITSVCSTKNVDSLTFWEQIDGGKQNTFTRKLFTVVPIVLCFLACIEAKWNVTLTILNGVIAFAAILGKLPFMHRTRIFGINDD